MFTGRADVLIRRPPSLSLVTTFLAARAPRTGRVRRPVRSAPPFETWKTYEFQRRRVTKL